MLQLDARYDAGSSTRHRQRARQGRGTARHCAHPRQPREHDRALHPCAGTAGTITITAGTRVIDTQARFGHATADTVTMSPNQNTLTVTADDLEPANDPVEANVLTVLAGANRRDQRRHQPRPRKPCDGR